MPTRTYPEPIRLMDDPLLARRVRPLALRVLGEEPLAGVTPSPSSIRGLVARGRALHGAALRRAPVAGLRALAGTGRRLLAAWRGAALERETRRQLAALDPRLLEDIGLSPGRIGELAQVLSETRCPPAGEPRSARVVRIEELEASRCCGPCPDEPREAA